MRNVAILGYGVVGSGTAALLSQNAAHIAQKTGQSLGLKYILDIREFPDSPFADRFVKDFAVIEHDPEVLVVVECIGGAGIALELARRALSAGKHFVTSNKELVAEHGDALMTLAAENNVNFMFEASVGGGIPILRPMAQCLAANRLQEICGILNGTTNYILTQMLREGIPFDEALREAQEKGYAEANPADDIEGKDTCRKLCILASLAYGRHVFPREVSAEGIANVTRGDVCFAEAQGYRIRLLGRAAARPDGKTCLYVAPHLVPEGHPLFAVEDVFNAILLTGDATGDVMFYGRGAGKMPTASAMVADVIDAARHRDAPKRPAWLPSDGQLSVGPDALSSAFYVRLDNHGGGEITPVLSGAEYAAWASTLSSPPLYRIRVL